MSLCYFAFCVLLRRIEDRCEDRCEIRLCSTAHVHGGLLWKSRPLAKRGHAALATSRCECHFIALLAGSSCAARAVASVVRHGDTPATFAQPCGPWHGGSWVEGFALVLASFWALGTRCACPWGPRVILG